MLTYILKRIFLMFPTMFAITMIIFVILNLTPGKPGSLQTDLSEGNMTVDSAQRESYKIFKEQFNLDKPILFNLRFQTDKKDVLGLLQNIANENGKISPHIRERSMEKLEDLGKYSVKPLTELLPVLSSNKLFSIATTALSVNAKDQENLLIAQWKTSEEDATAETRALLEKDWSQWYKKNQSRFEFTAVQKLSIFFTDTRFYKYFRNILRLDFGISHVDKKPVIGKILHKLKYSISLSITSILLAYFISVPIGMYSAVRRNSLPDKLITITLFMLYSLPTFFVGTLMLQFLSAGGTGFHIFPTGGVTSLDFDKLTSLDQIKDAVWHYILPVICMTYASLATLSRYARTGLLEVINSDYIRTARAKGLPEIVVIVRHAMRNGLIPVLTLLGSILPMLISGSVIIEYIFNIPGMGQYIIESIYSRDYNSVMGVELIAALLALVGILFSDISYALVDPRIKFD